ncbi:hypothetical protein GJ496_000645 [Pomphorhynchus laevis]|nr:hypothetical protein GJ496_000645 [Pomphorhynchus laevis]
MSSRRLVLKLNKMCVLFYAIVTYVTKLSRQRLLIPQSYNAPNYKPLMRKLVKSFIRSVINPEIRQVLKAAAKKLDK